MFRGMRRKGQLLPEAETIAMLQACTSGVLAVQGDDDYPYAVPLSYAYEDSSYNLVANPEAIKRDETKIVDARIAYSGADDIWSVGLWGKNLTNEVYYPAATTVGAAAMGIPGLAFPGQPRTFGVDFRYTFR